MRAAEDYDCLIIGAGIVGLAHALAALRHGLKVAVIDRDARAAGASVRNFGFVTVTGQEAGITWRRARRSRDIWAEVAVPAEIVIHQRGLLVCARRAEALACLEEFAATAMGGQCRLLSASQAADQPGLRHDLLGALHSPHEIRVESRIAIGQLTAWLAAKGVAFHTRTAATAVETGTVVTSKGRLHARHIVVCPGTDLVTLFPEAIARRRTTLCKLHMLRLASPGRILPAPVMSDLGLTRYLGYAGCASLPALRARLAAEQPAHLADGIHLIAVQDRDGSMVVGDSHHYSDTPDPFQPRAVDDRMLEELSATLDLPAPDVIERWIGVYPSGPDVCFAEMPAERVHLVMVTSGTGASTSFALAEETLARILDAAPPPHTAADWTPP